MSIRSELKFNYKLTRMNLNKTKGYVQVYYKS